MDTMGIEPSAARTLTDARLLPHAPRKLQRVAFSAYVTPPCRISEGTTTGGLSVKLRARKDCSRLAASGNAALDTRKVTDVHALPALPAELVRSTVSELQLLIACGMVMLTRGRVGDTGAEICTTACATVLQALQSAAVAEEHAALIRFLLTVTLFPTPMMVPPTADCGKMVKLESSVHWQEDDPIATKLRSAPQATLLENPPRLVGALKDTTTELPSLLKRALDTAGRGGSVVELRTVTVLLL
jgi:hypothetical protein